MCSHVYESPLYELSSYLVCLRPHWEVSRAEHKGKEWRQGSHSGTGGSDSLSGSGTPESHGTATGPRAVKGVGSHTTQGRLRPVLLVAIGTKNTLGNLSILGVVESSLASSGVCVNPNLLKFKHFPNSRDHSGRQGRVPQAVSQPLPLCGGNAEFSYLIAPGGFPALRPGQWDSAPGCVKSTWQSSGLPRQACACVFCRATFPARASPVSVFTTSDLSLYT